MSTVKEPQKKKIGKTKEKRPVDIIREMNPGKFIPTGAELAKMLQDREK